MKTQMIALGMISLAVPCLALADTDGKTNLDLPISKQMQSVEKQDASTVKNATRMMGHLSFAAQAIDLKMKKAALENLTDADKLCSALESSRPEVISKYEYKYGKTTYAVSGVDHDYYVPVADDVFVEGSFDEKAIWRKNPKVEEKGLAIVHSNLQLNLKDVHAAIQSTKKLVSEGKFEDAGRALNGVFKDAMSTQETVSNPVWTVWANLVLAQEFMQGDKYKSVRFALKAAQSDLDRLEKDGILSKSGDEAKALKAELEKIDKTLDEKDPSTTKKVQAAFAGWAKKVRAWL